MLNFADDRILRVIANDPLAQQAYTLASRDDWSNERFFVELIIAMHQRHNEFMNARLTQAANSTLPLYRQ